MNLCKLKMLELHTPDTSKCELILGRYYQGKEAPTKVGAKHRSNRKRFVCVCKHRIM